MSLDGEVGLEAGGQILCGLVRLLNNVTSSGFRIWRCPINGSLRGGVQGPANEPGPYKVYKFTSSIHGSDSCYSLDHPTCPCGSSPCWLVRAALRLWEILVFRPQTPSSFLSQPHISVIEFHLHFPNFHRLRKEEANAEKMSANDSSELSSVGSLSPPPPSEPPSEAESDEQSTTGILKFFKPASRAAAMASHKEPPSPPPRKREPSPPHEPTFADNPDIAVSIWRPESREDAPSRVSTS
jgi:hypothetical protein